MNKIDFENTYKNLRDTGFNIIPDRVFIKIPDAKETLLNGLNFLTNDNAQWQPEYDNIVEWLQDNKGKGLLCLGNCGRGKTLICGKIIPMIINRYARRIVLCYDAQQMNKNIDKVKVNHLIYLDDIGTEEASVKYGEKRLCFPEIADEAEKKGKLLLISTNLSIEELKTKYGERTIDRLKAITTPILFKGESLRK